MKKMHKYWVIMATVAALLILSLPAYASKADRRIISSARQSYIFKTILYVDDIKIESQNGNVTLTGIVADNFNKMLAAETLSGISGVKSVNNLLEIKGALPSPNSDAWIRDKVKGTLLFRRSVSAANTRVEVENGIVTLQGEATSAAQKDLTTEYTKDVEGVKDVNNQMTVAGSAQKDRTVGQKIDDASVTAQVKMTLLYHRSTSALNTKVETRRGVVTLSGAAQNAAEKNLAAKYAGDVNGVRKVKNRMTIE